MGLRLSQMNLASGKILSKMVCLAHPVTLKTNRVLP